MSLLYDRVVEVTVAGLEITDLRMSFDVSREIDETETTGRLDIYNLRPENEERIFQRGKRVTIRAGYPTTLATIYDGTVQQVVRIRDGLARVVRIDLGDMVRAASTLSGWTSKTWAGQVAVRSIATDIMADLKVPAGPLDAIPADATAQDWVWSGPSAAALTALLRRVNCRWFEEDGLIRINKTGMTQPDAPTIRLSPTSGLVKSPIVTDDGLEAEMFLRPDVVLGCIIDLESETFNGLYKVAGLRHIGDNYRNGRFITWVDLRAAPTESA